jgi:threonine dehydrogenase-like Zn-dependent dehydrogenase
VLGSQFVGVVRKINLPPDAGSLLLARKGWVGKRVVAPPSIPCTSCDLCRAGLSAHCRARAVLGIHQRDGCLAEAFCVPLSALCAVPDSVPDEHAVLAHALSGALHAANMLRSEHSSYITVLGDSLIALLCAQALAGMNKAVRLLSSRDDRQRLCERWGVKCRALDEPGRRQDQDVVVDCTGAAAGLRLALQLVRPRGIILLKSPGALAPFPPGRPLPPPRPGGPWAQGVDLTPAIVNEVQILGSRDGPIPDALRALQDHTIDVAGLITRRARLEDAPSALKAWSPETLGVSIEV